MSYRSSSRELIAGNLRAEMARQGKTSKDLADALSVSQSSASRRMNGTVPIRSEELDTIANLLGVRTDIFFESPFIPRKAWSA